MIKIHVRLLGDLREAIRKERLEIELPNNTSLKELIENKLLRYEGLKGQIIDPVTKRIRTDLIILINERSIESFIESERVKDGDTVTIASVVAGG
ncbi:MAG: MoaD/ThiS family protein [archaeon]|nr:MoaD/ThiS family protein [archaeon]MCP8315085.1 MoaD/ThiS family protein [archaeon]MCP8317846.1 MoaD/ThiS family protein [archaeon]MCP8319404.1 MoaD/ThiS family protein [archaeon]